MVHVRPSAPATVLALALATALFPFTVSRGQAPAAPTASIYFDRAHGEGPQPPKMQAVAARLGVTIQEGTTPIDASALQAHRLVYLRAPAAEFTEPERAAIVAFVKAGGSLLVVVDEEQRQQLAVTRVNDILAPFGLALTGDTPYLHNTGAMARAGEVTRAAYELPYSGGRAVEGGTAFAWQLDAGGRTAQPFAAYVTVPGGGRVVVMAEGMASLFIGSPDGRRLTGIDRDPRNTVYWGKDSEAFMADVFTWLLAR